MQFKKLLNNYVGGKNFAPKKKNPISIATSPNIGKMHQFTVITE